MTTPYPFRQRGISLIGMLLVASLLVVGSLIAAQVLPTVIEYQAVVKAVNKAREGSTPSQIRSTFDKMAMVDDIRHLKGSDLELSKEDGRIVVRFAYQREIHLVGPAYLTLKYQGQSQP
jgi:type II secretory pathway component PulJ